MKASLNTETNGSDFKFWAFISYSHTDDAWASWLHRGLERFRVPRHLSQNDPTLPNRLRPVFRDRDELASAPQLRPEIEAALKHSRNLIVICSPASATSPWVQEEIRYFKSLGRSQRVFCLIVEGEPGAENQDCFGPALRHGVNAEGKFDATVVEPIAADLRLQGDGRKDGFLKLVAGILGVGFDQLKQRQLQARNRRLSFLAAASLVLAAVMLALAYSATQARDLARAAQSSAEAARKDAERRLHQARAMEEVFTHMFRTAGERGEGDSVTARDILAASVKRINKQFDDDPQTAARVQQQIGTLYFYMDDYVSAERLLQEVVLLPQATNETIAMAAYDLAQARVRMGSFEQARTALDAARAIWQPEQERYADDLLQSAMLESQLLRASGDLEGAITTLEATLPKRLAISGENDRQSAVLMSNLGIAYVYAGRFEDARRLMTRAWDAFVASGSKDTQNALSTLSNLAALELRAGSLRLAEEHYENVIVLMQGAQPESASFAATVLGLSNVKMQLREFDLAEKSISQALELARKFTGERSPLTWAARVNMAQLNLQRGRRKQAYEELAEACPAGTELYGKQHARVGHCRLLLLISAEPSEDVSEQLQHEVQELRVGGHQSKLKLAEILSMLGEAELKRGDFVAAREHLEESAELFIALHGPDSYTVGRADALLGGLMILHGEPEAGQLRLKQGLATLEQTLGPKQAVSAHVLAVMENWRAHSSSH